MELNDINLMAGLHTNWLGRVCYYEPVVGSTNTLLKGMAWGKTAVFPPLPAGTIYLTDYQTHGRGRLQRQWVAPAATSLLFSLLFRPHWPPEQANWLTMMAGLAAAEAIEAATGLTVKLKWPNDVMLYQEMGWRKVGGILLEGDVGENGRLHSVIIGLGLNINIPPDQLPPTTTPATSLLAATGQPVDRITLLTDLLQRLEQTYETNQSPQPAWNKRLLTLGQAVRVTHTTPTATQIIEGTAEATDHWGYLLVRDAAGKQHTISAGDVTLRPAVDIADKSE